MESQNGMLEEAMLQDLVETIGLFMDTLVELSKMLQTTAPNIINFKRVYLGCTYSYNILTKLRFIIKSPKLIVWVTERIMWVFMKLPEKWIMCWPSPELRD